MSRAVDRKPLPKLSFRAFLEDAAFCGLTLSPVVAAIADASEGLPVTLPDDLCRTVFACAPSQLPREPRRTVCVEGGGRFGKSSRMLSPKALHAAITVPLPDVRREERGRAVLVAPDKDLADQDLDYVRGYAEDSAVIRRMLLPSPKTCVRIKRADGTVVDIRVGAATRGGKSVRARCLVFCGLDESAFFYSDSGHVVNDREIYRAAIQRVVVGGQVWIVSTPWIEEVGLLQERIKVETIRGGERDGERRHENSLTVARVGTRLGNPAWDPDGTIERDMRTDDPDNAAREIDAIPLAAGTSVFFDPAAVARCFEVKPFGTRLGVGAGGDFGFTSDCLAAAVVARHRLGEGASGSVGGEAVGFDWTEAHERRPQRGEPLKPSVAVREVGRFVADAGARHLVADGHYKETVREHLHEEGVQFISAPEGAEGKTETYLAFRKVMAEGRLRISVADPALRERIRAQLRSITKKALPGGGISISAPRRKAGPQGGTTHGDLVSAGVLAAWKAGAGRAGRAGEIQRGVAAGSTRWAGVARGRRARRSDVDQQ
jgi:hypothetical protein